MLALLALIFVGMAAVVLGMIYGPAAGRGRRRCGRASSLVAGPIVLLALVLLLGVYIPPALQRVLTRGSRGLGGGGAR